MSALGGETGIRQLGRDVRVCPKPDGVARTFQLRHSHSIWWQGFAAQSRSKIIAPAMRPIDEAIKKPEAAGRDARKLLRRNNDTVHHPLWIPIDGRRKSSRASTSTGRKAIVTGGAAGVGAETVRALAGAGAAVTMAVRRVDVAEPVAAELRRSAGNQAIDIKALDLSDLRSVKAFTNAWEGPLGILVNNAGIMAVPELEKDAAGLRTSVRHQLPWTLRAHHRFARGPCCSKRRPSRIGKLHRPSVLAGDFR